MEINPRRRRVAVHVTMPMTFINVQLHIPSDLQCLVEERYSSNNNIQTYRRLQMYTVPCALFIFVVDTAVTLIE